MSNIKFSIITVVYNGEEYIEETIKSVISQSYVDIEYIIIDGASTDNTCLIVNKYISQITYFISENDNGMYDAINKGISYATGNYILVLNSDDYLVNSEVLSSISNKIYNNDLDFFYCNIIRTKLNKSRLIRLKKYSFDDTLCSLHCSFVPHPSFFISTHFLQKNSLKYNLAFKYASDFDFILQCLRMSNNFKHLDIFSTVFREHPNSITSSGKIDSERIEILKKWNINNIYLIKRKWLYYKNWILYKIRN